MAAFKVVKNYYYLLMPKDHQFKKRNTQLPRLTSYFRISSDQAEKVEMIQERICGQNP